MKSKHSSTLHYQALKTKKQKPMHCYIQSLLEVNLKPEKQIILPHYAQRKPDDIHVLRNEGQKRRRAEKAVSDDDADVPDDEGDPRRDPPVKQPAPERREGGVGGAFDGEHGPGGDGRQLEVLFQERLEGRKVPGDARLGYAEDETVEEYARHSENV